MSRNRCKESRTGGAQEDSEDSQHVHCFYAQAIREEGQAVDIGSGDHFISMGQICELAFKRDAGTQSGGGTHGSKN
jgi:hypothetical protein